jgi:hypothetical protein
MGNTKKNKARSKSRPTKKDGTKTNAQKNEIAAVNDEAAAAADAAETSDRESIVAVTAVIEERNASETCAASVEEEERLDAVPAMTNETELSVVKALKRVQAVVRGWKTRARLQAELAKASVELGGPWETFELAPSEKVTKGPMKASAMLPKASGQGEMFVTTSYVCFDAKETKEDTNLLTALLPKISDGPKQALRLKIPLFDLESVAPKVTYGNFFQTSTSLIMLFKDKAFKPKEFVDVEDIEGVVETINVQLRQRANDISNARLMASMAEVALKDRRQRLGKAHVDLRKTRFFEVAKKMDDKLKTDLDLIKEARNRYANRDDDGENTVVATVKNDKGEDISLSEDEIKLLPNAIARMKVKHANEMADMRRQSADTVNDISERYSRKIKELEARVIESDQAAHNERDDRNKIVKSLNEQVTQLKTIIKSSDSEAAFNIKKLDDRLASIVAENEKFKWYLERAEQSKTAAEMSLQVERDNFAKLMEVERENFSKYSEKYSSGEKQLAMSLEEKSKALEQTRKEKEKMLEEKSKALEEMKKEKEKVMEEKSKALEEMKKLHEQIKDNLNSEGLTKSAQLAETKQTIIALQKETAKYEKEVETLNAKYEKEVETLNVKYEKEVDALTKENLTTKKMLEQSRENQKDAMENIEKLTKELSEMQEKSEKKIAMLSEKLKEMQEDTKVVVQDHVELVEEDIFRNCNFVVMESKLKLVNEEVQRLTVELIRARQSEGIDRVGIAAQALQERLDSAEERAQFAQENASRLESKRAIAEQMLATMKRALAESQKEQDSLETGKSSSTSALAVLSGIKSREYSMKHAIHFDPRQHEMVQGGDVMSTPISKMAKFNTPGKISTPASKSAKYASPVIDTPMSSLVKSRSGEFAMSSSPAGMTGSPIIVERIVEKIVEVPVYRDVPTVVEKVIEKVVEKKVTTGITESDLQRAKDLGKAELKSEIEQLEKLKKETAPKEIEVEKIVEVYLTQDDVKKKNEQLLTKIEALENSIAKEQAQKKKNEDLVKKLEKELKEVRKALDSKKPVIKEKIVELEYHIEVPTGISEETLKRHEKKIIEKFEKESAKVIKEAEEKVANAEKNALEALGAERKSLDEIKKSLDIDTNNFKKKVEKETVEFKKALRKEADEKSKIAKKDLDEAKAEYKAKIQRAREDSKIAEDQMREEIRAMKSINADSMKAFEVGQKEARTLLSNEIKRFKSKEVELSKQSESLAKNIESAKANGFKEAEQTYCEEIDRLKKIESSMEDEINRTRLELNKEFVAKLSNLESLRKESEKKYIAEIAQLRASAVAPSIVAAATDMMSTASADPAVVNKKSDEKDSEVKIQYVEVADKESVKKFDAEIARLSKEHEAKLKESDSKIEKIKKSHQLQIKKIETDFENEIKALKNLDADAAKAREQGQKDAMNKYEHDMNELRKNAENEKKQLEKTISKLETEIENATRKAKNELEDVRRSLEREKEKISDDLARAKNASDISISNAKFKLELSEKKTQELEKKIASMQERISSPDEQAKAIEKQDKERMQLQTEKIKLQAKVKSLEEKVSLHKLEMKETLLNSPAQVSSRDMQKLKDQAVEARADHEAARDELIRVQSENTRLSREIATLEVEKAKNAKPPIDPKLAEELSKLKDQFAKSMEDKAIMETKLSFLERDAPAMRKELLTLEAEKKKLEAKISMLESIERELNARAINAEKGKVLLEKSVGDYEKREKATDSSLRNLEKENSLHAQRREQLEKEASASETKISKLTESNSENERNLSAQTARLSEIEKQRALLDKRVERLEKEKAEFEAELEESKELGYVLQNTQTRLQSVEQTLRETVNTWKDLEEKHELAKEELERAQRSEETLKQTLKSLEKECAAFESKSKHMAEELERNEEKLKRLAEAETKLAVEAEKHKLNEEKFKNLEQRTEQIERRAEILALKELELVGVKEKLIAHEAQKKMFEKEVKQAQEKQSMLESTIETRRGEYQAVISKMSEAEREVANAKVAAAMAKEYASNSRDTLEKVQEREIQMREELTQIRIAYEALTVEYREKAFEYASNAARLEKVIADLQRQVALLEQKAEALVEKNHQQDLEKQKLLNHIKNQEYDMEQLRKESLGYYNAYVKVNEQLKRTQEMLNKEVRDSQQLHNAIAMGKQNATNSYNQIGYGNYNSGGGYSQQQQQRLNLAPPPEALSSFSPDKPTGRFQLLPPPDDIKDMLGGNNNMNR